MRAAAAALVGFFLSSTADRAASIVVDVDSVARVDRKIKLFCFR